MPSFDSLNVEISKSSIIGKGTKIWSNSQIRERVSIGKNCIFGRNVNIGPDVVVGDNCKIQNGVEINGPCVIENGVFIGPGVVLTNDRFPRAINHEGNLKNFSEWNQSEIYIGMGASVGANSTLVAPVKIGKWALIGAGSLVSKNVKNFALAFGNPCRQRGWVGKAGYVLIEKDSFFECPITKQKYVLMDENLIEV